MRGRVPCGAALTTAAPASDPPSTTPASGSPIVEPEVWPAISPRWAGVGPRRGYNRDVLGLANASRQPSPVPRHTGFLAEHGLRGPWRASLFPEEALVAK